MGEETGRARSVALDSARRTVARLEELGVNLDAPLEPWFKGPAWGGLLGQTYQFAQDCSRPGGRGWFARKPIGRFAGMTEEELAEAKASGKLLDTGPVHRLYALTLRGAIELVPYLESPAFESRRIGAETQRQIREAKAEARARTPELELVHSVPSSGAVAERIDPAREARAALAEVGRWSELAEKWLDEVEAELEREEDS